MTSKELVAHFASHGIKVRVRELGNKHRICPVVNGSRYEGFCHYTIALIANALGYTDALGNPIGWSAFNGYRELCAYKPGYVVRVRA